MVNKKKIIQQVTEQTITEDGQLKESSKTQVFSMEREPDYIKLYMDDIMRLSDIPKSSSNILFAVIKRMNYSNDIALYAPIKREIANELGIKEVTLKKAIELFVDKSILLRKDRGLYIINPYFFGRGKWEDIKKIRLKIEYSKTGKMVLQTEFEYEQKI